LKILNCNDNRLVNLDLNGLSKLEGLNCDNNYLTDLVLSPLQTEQLTYLEAQNNNFPSQDCSIFAKSTNLKELRIGNDNQEKIEQGIYNRFTGSLETLKNLSKLESLDISNTDIDSGLEHLSDSLEKLNCSTKYRKDAKVKGIKED
jgi:Leucine-rich repeat (LRR) protein